MTIYTEYNDDRVKQLMELSKRNSHTLNRLEEYFIFLMSVDYHCREEVGIEIPENEELKNRYEIK